MTDAAATVLVETVNHLLGRLKVKAWRVSLDTPGVAATIPMIRGVIGAALHDLDPHAYSVAFDGAAKRDGSGPAYVLRPAIPSDGAETAIDLILLGRGVSHGESFLRAIDVASGMGLGADRSRFMVRTRQALGPEGPGFGTGLHVTWSLDAAVLPAGLHPLDPCRVSFSAPLRLLRNGRLVEAPTLEDIAMGALRRMGAFLNPAERAIAGRLSSKVPSTARSMPEIGACWERLDLRRYSARQRRDLVLRGVTGSLLLPEGPGPLWPLLAASQWLHVGKSTIVGLGQPVIEMM